jgi:hypothetical protein
VKTSLRGTFLLSHLPSHRGLQFKASSKGVIRNTKGEKLPPKGGKEVSPSS